MTTEYAKRKKRLDSKLSIFDKILMNKTHYKHFNTVYIMSILCFMRKITFISVSN